MQTEVTPRLPSTAGVQTLRLFNTFRGTSAGFFSVLLAQRRAYWIGLAGQLCGVAFASAFLDAWFAWLLGGVLVGAALRDVGTILRFKKSWPAIDAVLNWSAVDAVLAPERDS